MCLRFAPAMPSPLRVFEKLPLARQMHSQRSVDWGVIEEVAASLAIQNMERDAPWTAWSKMLQLR
jgi:hypothetical protein